jgi:stage V sporulation protein B
LNKLFKAVAIITIFSVITRIIGFLFRIFLSRVLGAEGMGVYQIAFSVFMVLETVVSSGLPIVLSKLTSKYEAEGNKKSQFAATTAAVIIGLISAAILCTVIFAFQNLFGKLFTDLRSLNILLTLLPGIVFASVYSALRGYLWGQKKFFLVSITEFFEQILRVAACVIILAFIYQTFDTAIAASLSLTISCFLSALIVIGIYFKVGGKFVKPKGEFKSLLKSAAPITGIRLASSLLMPLIAIIIPLRLIAAGFTNSQALAQYGIAMGMTFPLLYLPSTLTGSLAMALVPDISSHLATNDYKSIANKIESSIKFSIFVAFLFIPIYLGLGEQIGIFLFNNATAGYYLSYAAWIMVPFSVNNIASAIQHALGQELKGFINYIIGAVVLVLCIVFLPKYVGVLSLVWGMGACLTIAAVLNIRLIKKRVPVKIKVLQPLILQTIITLPCSFLASWTFGALKTALPLFVNLAVSGTLTVVMYLLLCSAFKVADVFSIFVKFIKTRKTSALATK